MPEGNRAFSHDERHGFSAGKICSHIAVYYISSERSLIHLDAEGLLFSTAPTTAPLTRLADPFEHGRRKEAVGRRYQSARRIL